MVFQQKWTFGGTNRGDVSENKPNEHILIGIRVFDAFAGAPPWLVLSDVHFRYP